MAAVAAGGRWQRRQRQKLPSNYLQLRCAFACRVLAAAVYIFCASVIPALAFGEQLYLETSGALSAVQGEAVAAPVPEGGGSSSAPSLHRTTCSK